MDIQQFEINFEGRDFVCGDIHGCFSHLNDKLDSVNFDESVDRLFSVGDLVDRGPESMDVIDWLDKPWFHAVIGNHEQMLLDTFNTPPNSSEQTLWFKNGGVWWASLTPGEKVLIADMISTLPLLIEIKTRSGLIGIVHADLPLTGFSWNDIKDCVVNNDEQIRATLIWGRKRINVGVDTFVKGVDTVYCGHTILGKPTTLGNVRFIDTGSFMYKDPNFGITIEQIS